MLSVRRVVFVADKAWENICSTFSSSLGSTLLLIERSYNYPIYLRVINNEHSSSDNEKDNDNVHEDTQLYKDKELDNDIEIEPAVVLITHKYRGSIVASFDK